MKFIVETYYEEADTDCTGDYWAMKLISSTGDVILDLGDYYHDKSSIRIEAFLEGVRWATGSTIDVTEINIHKDY